MNKYLVTKLAEECSEVSQAACKVLLHQDKQSREALLSEMADVQAMIFLAENKMTRKDKRTFANLIEKRMDREADKGKA